jgi:superfamily I DNA/RNA helicase
MLRLQLLLEASGVLPELQAAMDLKAATARRTSKDLEELRKLRKRIGNLKTLVKLARNTAAYTESPVLGLPEVETATGFEAEYGVKSDAGSMSIKISSSDGHVLGISSNSSSSSSSSSQLPLLQPTMGLPLLQQLYDHCVLQGEDDGDDDDAEKVQLMTMHASKGKEFACVSVLRVHEGAIPSIRKDELSGSAAALEQERNLLYVAITRAKE